MIDVPLVVLIDHPTASAAEDFLIFLDSAKRATLVGRPTHGSTGQPLPLDLPGGGRARVCAKRDTYPDGRDFVGFGIQPDHPVTLTVDSVRTGEDVILAEGMRVMDRLLGASP